MRQIKVGVQVHAATDLTPGEKPPVSNEYEAKWACEPLWMMWRGQNLFLLSVGYNQFTIMRFPNTSVVKGSIASLILITKFCVDTAI